ncbi:MAG TPA: OsmC family protein [Bacteroidales bacterium]|nr:OsmC family protein [Bacteroidales bacterium]
MEITFDGGKIVTAHIRGFEVKTDQPVSNGGTETAPSPFELYLASLGTCAAIYVKSFCDNRQISTEGVKLVQKTSFSPETGLPVKIVFDIRLPAGFPEKYRESLINVAALCKVKKSILSPPAFEIISSVP